MKQLQFSTLIVLIDHIDDESVEYVVKTDNTKSIKRHVFPNLSQFPFNELKLDHWYAIICAKSEGIWYWVVSWELTTKETLCDQSLMERVLEE